MYKHLDNLAKFIITVTLFAVIVVVLALLVYMICKMPIMFSILLGFMLIVWAIAGITDRDL